MTPLNRDVPRIVGPLPGPRSAAWLKRDDRVMSPSYTRAYPLVVRRARGAMIEDMDGNRFLDFTAGIAVTNVGHSHPRVVAAIRRQANRLIHMSGTDFYYAPQVRLAERLAALAPGPGEKRVFFTNSGAEAIEAALKLARRHTGRNRVMAFMNAFHGRTYGAMSLSGSKPMQRRGFSPLVPDIHHARYGDLESVHALIRTVCPPDELAAIFVEPIQGEGGYIVPPADFLPGLRRLCDEHGVLLVFDEIQSGMGRTGKMFASRALGRRRRYPVHGQGDRQRPAAGSHRGQGVGHGLAQRQPCLDIRRQPGGVRRLAGDDSSAREALHRQCRSSAASSFAMAWRAWPIDYSFIREVRGLGLMIGLEIQSESGEPDPGLRDELIEMAFQRGLLLLPCGPSTVRFCPPLCLTARQVEIGLELLAGDHESRRPESRE